MRKLIILVAGLVAIGTIFAVIVATNEVNADNTWRETGKGSIERVIDLETGIACYVTYRGISCAPMSR